MLFAAAGYKVRLFDIQPEQVQSALVEIEKQLYDLEKSKLLRGSTSAKEQVALISGKYFIILRILPRIKTVLELLILSKKVESSKNVDFQERPASRNAFQVQCSCKNAPLKYWLLS